MVNARFVTDSATVDVKSESVASSVNVNSAVVDGRVSVSSYPPTMQHNKLSNRNLPDQHPIEAITGLQEALNRLDTFVFEQATASDTWEITHNLGRYPCVEIVDTAGNKFFPAVQWVNENKIIVTMNGATKGKAFLN